MLFVWCARMIDIRLVKRPIALTAFTPNFGLEELLCLKWAGLERMDPVDRFLYARPSSLLGAF